MSDEWKVTVLPPGRAKGAGDLNRWAGRRLAGMAGLPTAKKKPKRKIKKFRKKAFLDRIAPKAKQITRHRRLVRHESNFLAERMARDKDPSP